MTDEEFEKMWAECKRMEAVREAQYNALPEDERKRLEKEFSDPSMGRFIEDPLGNDDENIPKEVLETAAKHRLGEFVFSHAVGNIQYFVETNYVDEMGLVSPTGLPIFIVWDGISAEIVSGEEALQLIPSNDD